MLVALPWLKQAAKAGPEDARSGNIWAAMACSGGVNWQHGERVLVVVDSWTGLWKT
jgi:hypothetical protein